MLERDAPVQLESRTLAGQDIPAEAEPYAGQGLEVMGPAARDPCSTDIDELGELHHVFAAREFEQGDPAFERRENRIVSDQRIFPIAAYAESSAYRDLFEGKQPVVGELQIDSPQDLCAPQRVQPFYGLGLSQPGHKFAAGQGFTTGGIDVVA
jgi:hypothetical protein